MIATSVVAALALPVTADAAKVLGDKLEIYGKLHVSIDASDRDDPSVTAKEDISVSENSSRFGVKGKHKIGDSGLSVVYKLEQGVNISGTGGTFATRNSYVGLKGSFGQVIVGHHDTPFKTVGSKWGVFGDSVGERRAVLGAGATGGNTMNQRGRNALMWSNKIAGAKVMAMYATDAGDSSATSPDNNDLAMFSVGVLYKSKNSPFYFGAAFEDWDMLKGSATDGFRIMGGYKGDFGKVGVIYEDISASANADLDRSVYGVNGVFKLSKGLDIRGQVLIADDYKGVANSGATKVGVGLYKKLDKKTKIYAVYAQTDNDTNAQYQAVDGGHGDEVKTALGGTPNSFSVGMEYKF